MWICSNPRGHILATGRDARGRKQYRYHPDWRALRDETKFDRMVAFAGALPDVRARLADDLALRGLPREKVLAAVVSIIDRTLIRVGNEEYARQNGSFGATTLRDDHAQIVGGELRLSFRGKSGQGARVRGATTPGSRASCAAARTCRASSSSATSTRRARRARSTRAT